ncbi:hypothetical protein J6590_035426 [Homalodisca vitripennis]|nr:hypothetical protein J6590_035426 [Homalodisca vitripennis]
MYGAHIDYSPLKLAVQNQWLAARMITMWYYLGGFAVTLPIVSEVRNPLQLYPIKAGCAEPMAGCTYDNDVVLPRRDCAHIDYSPLKLAVQNQWLAARLITMWYYLGETAVTLSIASDVRSPLPLYPIRAGCAEPTAGCTYDKEVVLPWRDCAHFHYTPLELAVQNQRLAARVIREWYYLGETAVTLSIASDPIKAGCAEPMAGCTYDNDVVLPWRDCAHFHYTPLELAVQNQRLAARVIRKWYYLGGIAVTLSIVSDVRSPLPLYPIRAGCAEPTAGCTCDKEVVLPWRDCGNVIHRIGCKEPLPQCI